MKEDYSEDVKDAGIIGAAQRVEHYEIAGYGTVRTFAELLGESEHVSLLEKTLNEEKQADVRLTQLAERINPSAVEGAGTVEPPRETSRTKSKRAA